MHFGLATSLVVHGGLLIWALLTIKATPPLPLLDTTPIEVSIISEIGLENLQRKGDTSSKNLDASGKDGSSKKEPPKKDVKAPPPPAPPPPAAEVAPPPPPEPPKPDEVAALIEKQPPPEPPKVEPQPKPPEPAVTPDDQAALLKKLEEAEKTAAAEAERKKVEAEAKAKTEADARAKELERQKKLAEEREKKRVADLAKRKAADAAKAKADADAKAKAFNPDAIAKAIETSSEDGKQQLLKDNRKPVAAQPAGSKSDNASKNKGPVAGAPDGTSDKLTATQLALFGQIMRSSVINCMNINAGAEGMERLPPFEIEVRLKSDGQLAAQPKLISSGSGPLFNDATNSAMRALIQCAPYTNLPPSLYTGGWDHMIVPFDIAKMSPAMSAPAEPKTMSRTSHWTRRDALRAGASALAAGAATPVLGQTRIPAIDKSTMKPRPIAIADFFGDDPKFAADVANVIAADLHNSGLFRIIDRGAHIERITNINQTPRSPDWRSIGAEALLVGQATRSADGRLQADFRLWDTIQGRSIDGQSLRGQPNVWRRLSHQIADRVYEKLTLEKGYFDTQIVFIDETGPKNRRLKRLTIMDQDGFGPRLLSDGKDLTLTPRFSPTQQEITYTQYVDSKPRVMLMNIDSGQRETVGNFPALAFAPRFSPDGQRLVLSVEEQGSTNLVEMDLRSKQMRRFTQGQGIATGPCYSPDGRSICFESDREGGTHIFVMSLANGAIQRISRSGGRYSTPVWSPRGDYIAFTKQEGGQFLIGVMKPDGTGERVLSTGFHNEGPTWAPNGRVLMFFREGQGANAGPKLFSVDITGYNERNIPTPAFGSDPAWGPLRA